MQGHMMFQPLLISSLIEHAEQYHADTEIIAKNTDASITVSNWQQISNHAKCLAKSLQQLGLKQGDRVATIAWNNHRHLAAWYAISGSGLVCHTINPRLFPEQLTYIIQDAQDQVILFDKTFLPLIINIKAQISCVKHFICLDAYDAQVVEALAEVQFYDDLIAEQKPDYIWPQLDEQLASSMCYTSGTTGKPKGVVYSHRSTVLHSYAISLPDSLNLSAKDVIMPVVPMFHVNAWGIPYAAAMVGAKLVLPGPQLDGESLTTLIDHYQVSIALGVPTIWQGLLSSAKTMGSTLASMQRNVVGGSACPPSMIASFKMDFQCDTIHAWGMTETSPLGVVNQLKAKHVLLPQQAQDQLRLSQGRPPFGVKLRLTSQENGTKTLANDGQTTGHLQIKGHWIVDRYFGQEQNSLTADAWFDTGDIGSLDPDGYLMISDRAKDLIKSGGEWISSVELENIAMAHAEIEAAAVIGAKHIKWEERPILIVKLKTGSLINEVDILDYFAGKIAKWQIPDQVILIEQMPIGGTGKILKKDLRAQFSDVLLVSGE